MRCIRNCCSRVAPSAGESNENARDAPLPALNAALQGIWKSANCSRRKSLKMPAAAVAAGAEPPAALCMKLRAAAA
jgi:hypothetical protein